MLVLSRKVGQRLIIADNVVITVTEIERGRVRLGVEAPPAISVLREEIYVRERFGEAIAKAVGAGR